MKQFKHEDDFFLGLTEELILDILYRLPVKSLGKCKLVCKSWLTLISDPEFAICHLKYSKSNIQPLTLISQRYNVISSLKFRDLSDITEGVTLTRLEHEFLSYGFFDSGYCFIVGSSDGIVCVYVKEMEKKRHGQDSMHLWNPCTTEEMEITLAIKRGSFYVHIVSSWFGSVPSCNDYKICLVFEVYRPNETWMHIYSLRYDRWVKIHHVSGIDLDSISSANSVFLDEALHYLVGRKWIIRFDLVTETFEKLPFSIKPDLVPGFDQLMLGVIQEYDCLCAMFVHCSEEWMFELWTLEEYGNWDSWEKLYRIELQEDIVRNCIKFLGFTYTGNLCVFNNKMDSCSLTQMMIHLHMFVVHQRFIRWWIMWRALFLLILYSVIDLVVVTIGAWHGTGSYASMLMYFVLRCG